MIITVTNEVPFQILSSSFSIGPSQSGYELQVGADSRSFSTLFSVGANTPRMVTNVANGSYFRLKNNVGEVKVNWQRVCVTEGGGASGTELSPVSEFPAGAEAGTVIAYSGSSSAAGIYQFDGTDWVAAGGSVDLSAYWTSAETQSAITVVEDHLFDVEEVTASALTELHEGLLELSARTGGDSTILKPVSEFPEDAEIGDAISMATPMSTFWWNFNDNITVKMHIDLDVLDTGETYEIVAFVSEEYGPVYGRLVYDSGAEIWMCNFYDQNDEEVRTFDLEDSGTANISVGGGFYASIGYLEDDFTEAGGNMLQIGRTDGTFGNWDGNVRQIPEFAESDINIDGIPGIPFADGLYFYNGTDWVGSDFFVQEYLDTEVLPRIDQIEEDIDTLDEVVANALVDLNEKNVESQDIKHIVKLTQAEYDQLVLDDEVDPETFYIIVNNN